MGLLVPVRINPASLAFPCKARRGWIWAEDYVKGDHTKGARFVVTLPAEK
jgi:hypothetical protein